MHVLTQSIQHPMLTIVCIWDGHQLLIVELLNKNINKQVKSTLENFSKLYLL